MHNPEHFTETDAAKIAAVLRSQPLTTLICQTAQGVVVNHIPLMQDGSDRLIGHIAKANTLHIDCASGVSAVAVFTGQDSYISPNWYPSKADTHQAVPTWNYIAVHMHGNLQFSHTKKDKIAAVGKLTKWQEELRFGTEAWRMADAPAPYMAKMIDNIVAITMNITHIEAKFKLGQNRVFTDFEAVTTKMAETDKIDLAKAMQDIKPNDT